MTATRDRRPAPGLAVRAALMLGGLAAGLALAEGLVRLRDGEDTLGIAREKWEFRDGGKRILRAYTLDPELGFRPLLGRPGWYSEHGTLPNGYPAGKRPGVERLLFIGDSVTAEGKVVRALARRYGQAGREYWNAGVHAFNTVQEERYYVRYNAAVRPDHVILTFHNNDLESTPVAFLNGEGQLVVYSPAVPLGRTQRWLFRWSRLYRLFLGARLGASAGSDAAVVEETRRALLALREDVARDGARLTVVLLPILRPWERWTKAERWSREVSLRLFDELGLRVVDLLPSLDAALAATPPEHVDPWHPSDGAAERFAEFLAEKELLGPAPPATTPTSVVRPVGSSTP